MVSGATKRDGFLSLQNSTSPLDAGIELYPYPTTKTFAIGLNVTF
jgi:hypothetical protein